MNDKLDKLEDIKEENLIWIIYIIIIILSYYANSKEKKYLLYNDEEARTEYHSGKINNIFICPDYHKQRF